MLFLVSGIFVTILGIVLLVLAIWGSKKYLSKTKRCTATVEGVITRLEKKEIARSDNLDSPTSNYLETFYYPVYEYCVDGARFEVQSSLGKRREDATLLGQKKQICYNPDDCSECYISGETMKLGFNIVKILGIIFVIAGVADLAIYTILKIIGFSFI